MEMVLSIHQETSIQTLKHLFSCINLRTQLWSSQSSVQVNELRNSLEAFLLQTIS